MIQLIGFMIGVYIVARAVETMATSPNAVVRIVAFVALVVNVIGMFLLYVQGANMQTAMGLGGGL